MGVVTRMVYYLAMSDVQTLSDQWSVEGARVEAVLTRQGRSTAWLASQLGITRNHLWRQRLRPENPNYRRPSDRLWQRIEDVLGVPGEITGASRRRRAAAVTA